MANPVMMKRGGRAPLHGWPPGDSAGRITAHRRARCRRGPRKKERKKERHLLLGRLVAIPHCQQQTGKRNRTAETFTKAAGHFSHSAWLESCLHTPRRRRPRPKPPPLWRRRRRRRCPNLAMMLCCVSAAVVVRRSVRLSVGARKWLWRRSETSSSSSPPPAAAASSSPEARHCSSQS